MDNKGYQIYIHKHIWTSTQQSTAWSPHPPHTTANLIGDISLVVPTQTVELPSRGMFYKEGTSLIGKESIEIKALTAKEEDILSSAEYLKAGTVFDKLLDSIIIDKTIDHTELGKIGNEFEELLLQLKKHLALLTKNVPSAVKQLMLIKRLRLAFVAVIAPRRLPRT